MSELSKSHAWLGEFVLNETKRKNETLKGMLQLLEAQHATIGALLQRAGMPPPAPSAIIQAARDEIARSEQNEELLEMHIQSVKKMSADAS